MKLNIPCLLYSLSPPSIPATPFHHLQFSATGGAAFAQSCGVLVRPTSRLRSVEADVLSPSICSCLSLRADEVAYVA